MVLDGNDEAYNIYDKPWRSENTLSNHLYRPPKNRDDELYGGSIEDIKKSKRFVPDKGFAGADESGGGRSGRVKIWLFEVLLQNDFSFNSINSKFLVSSDHQVKIRFKLSLLMN